MALYIKDNQLPASSELMRLQQMPEPDALRHGSMDWVGLLKK